MPHDDNNEQKWIVQALAAVACYASSGKHLKRLEWQVLGMSRERFLVGGDVADDGRKIDAVDELDEVLTHLKRVTSHPGTLKTWIFLTEI